MILQQLNNQKKISDSLIIQTMLEEESEKIASLPVYTMGTEIFNKSSFFQVDLKSHRLLSNYLKYFHLRCFFAII